MPSQATTNPGAAVSISGMERTPLWEKWLATKTVCASAALLVNALKHLAGVDHEVKLIKTEAIVPIQDLKVRFLGGKNPRLHTDEVLIALTFASMTYFNAKRALEQLPNLRGCQVHTTVMLSDVDIHIFKRLGVDLTSDPVLTVKKYH